MKLRFDTPAEREQCQRHIDEAAREIEDTTPLLRALYTLLNGGEETAPSGLCWVDMNDPQSAVVNLPEVDRELFDTITERLAAADAAALGDPESDQLTTLADYLSETAETLQEAAVFDDVGDTTETPAEHGTLRDSYHAALQHDIDVPDDSDRVLGVVREPMYGIHNQIDENWSTLAPPETLLSEFKTVADEVGHNQAVSEVDFRERYRDHLQGEEQQTRISEIRELLADGVDVWVVCYENTDEKFCHRDILKKVVKSE